MPKPLEPPSRTDDVAQARALMTRAMALLDRIGATHAAAHLDHAICLLPGATGENRTD